MLESEYVELMGLESVSSEEFELANDIYMLIPLDKFAFCEDYKKHKGSSIIACLYYNLQFYIKEVKLAHVDFLNIKEKLYQLQEKYDALRFDTYEAKGGW